jgi:broad specificity phosphatase PhoE
LSLFLVRHGRPRVDRGRPAHEWPLDPAYDHDVRRLRPRLPAGATWYSSPEPKAFMTTRLLTESPIEVVPDLREHERHTPDWIDDFEDVVRRAFEEPDLPAYDGWAPISETRTRVVGAVARILTLHPGGDVVMVGHGTAWTLVRSALEGGPPDLEWWSSLSMPDVVQCGPVVGRGDMLST